MNSLPTIKKKKSKKASISNENNDEDKDDDCNNADDNLDVDDEGGKVYIFKIIEFFKF